MGEPESLFFSGGYIKPKSRSYFKGLFVSLRLYVAVSALEYPY